MFFYNLIVNTRRSNAAGTPFFFLAVWLYYGAAKDVMDLTKQI
jgi:hypothetical protein